MCAVVVLAFTVPKIYELKKDDIDSAVSSAHHHGKVHYNKYVEPYVNKIPRASTSSTSANTPTAAAGNGASFQNNKPSALSSDADSFLDVDRDAVAGISSEGKKLS